MPNTTLSAEVIVEEVRAALGGSAVEIELADEDIKLAVRRTLRKYNHYIPRRTKHKLTVTTAQKKYRLDHLHTKFQGVADVEFITMRTPVASIDPFDPYSITPGGAMYSEQTFGDVVQRRMYAEDAQRIISSEPEWFAQWETVGNEQHYYLYVDIPRNSVECGYTAVCSYDDTDAGRQMIPEQHTSWFMDYVIALSQLHLARVRGKHGGIVNPDGASDPMDSDTDRSEATQRLIELEDALKLMRPPLMPLTE